MPLPVAGLTQDPAHNTVGSGTCGAVWGGAEGASRRIRRTARGGGGVLQGRVRRRGIGPGTTPVFAKWRVGAGLLGDARAHRTRRASGGLTFLAPNVCYGVYRYAARAAPP
ncbi:hypothetical protein GCM10022402_30820 [Salinactinospora qingdaonensis]|uniref:Uncharacterized protein n=1 Tax=Salinactinospora qingdaonensis TaxID=702744 RepID=A0ABP7FY00_9ACTN